MSIKTPEVWTKIPERIQYAKPEVLGFSDTQNAHVAKCDVGSSVNPCDWGGSPQTGCSNGGWPRK